MKAYLSCLVISILFIFSSAQAATQPIIPKNWSYRIADSEKDLNKASWIPTDGPYAKLDYQGFIEYRAYFFIPSSYKDQKLGIYLGSVGDADVTLVNGVIVGTTGEFPPRFSSFLGTIREYYLPSELIKFNKRNELIVRAYTENTVLKGVEPKKVKVDNHNALQQKKYWADIFSTFARLFIPILCLILSFFSLPWGSLRKTQIEQVIIFVMGTSYFVYGLGKSRLVLHLVDTFSGYKIVLISAMIGIATVYFYALRKANINMKTPYIVGSLILIAFITMFLLDSKTSMGNIQLNAWYAVESVLVLSSTWIVIKYTDSKQLWLKLSYLMFTIIVINDCLHALFIIRTTYLMEIGFGAFIVFVILLKILDLHQASIEFARREEALAADIKIGKLALQVAHDIRSPLVALNMLLESLNKVAETKRIVVRRSINRINDIANNLLTQYRKPSFSANKSITAELIFIMVDNIISELSIQNPKIKFIKKFESSSYSTFSSVNSGEFKRAISNLINNAVQAITENGIIIIKLAKKTDVLKLYIIDNGCGISNQRLPEILKGEANNTKSGTGLGLSYAINRFKAWGCILDITSEIMKGTTIDIAMPCSKPADWFMPTLRVSQESTIVVLDDDESIHGVWDQRFKVFSLEDKIQIKHFTDPTKFYEWHRTCGNSNILYLIDYELLGHNVTGIDIIKNLKIASSSILVTSYFEDENIRLKSKNLNLKTIPKVYSLYIPIEIISVNPDIILIDDNTALTDAWKIRGKAVGKKIATFNNINDFVGVMDLYNRSIPIYVDFDLSDKITGDIFAKTLYDHGYKEIYLCTGYDKNRFDALPWITSILSKDIPF